MNLDDYLRLWLTDRSGTACAPQPMKATPEVRNHLIPTLGPIKLRALTPTHLRGLYRDKLDSGLSPRTVQYIHVTIHKALKQALNDGLVPRNVAEAVKPPQVRREEIEPLTPEQTKKLVEFVSEDRLAALYVLAVTAGLRQGELLASSGRT